jgi:hypothetical protein
MTVTSACQNSASPREPMVHMFRFFVATDCFVETCLATDRFGALIPNSGSQKYTPTGSTAKLK